LVPQPTENPRAFTTIVFVLNGEDWAETQTRKENWRRQNREHEPNEEKLGEERKTEEGKAGE
jgi:hypothetical protein